MDFSIEARPLGLITEKDDGLPLAQRHRRFRILTPTFFLTRVVHQHFGALDHEAFDRAFILMTRRSAHRRIKVSKLEWSDSIMPKYLFTRVRHIPNILACPH